MTNTKVKRFKVLTNLKDEHQALEAKIFELMRSKVVNPFLVQKLRKQKLMIKESISRLENQLVSDIIA
jgi:hypothetical protein